MRFTLLAPFILSVPAAADPPPSPPQIGERLHRRNAVGWTALSRMTFKSA